MNLLLLIKTTKIEIEIKCHFKSTKMEAKQLFKNSILVNNYFLNTF